MESVSPLGSYFHTHMNNAVCPFVHKHGNTETDWGRGVGGGSETWHNCLWFAEISSSVCSIPPLCCVKWLFFSATVLACEVAWFPVAGTNPFMVILEHKTNMGQAVQRGEHYVESLVITSWPYWTLSALPVENSCSAGMPILEWLLPVKITPPPLTPFTSWFQTKLSCFSSIHVVISGYIIFFLKTSFMCNKNFWAMLRSIEKICLGYKDHSKYFGAN